MTKPMTVAQKMQQENRDHGGRYAHKHHSEVQGVELPPLPLVSDEAAEQVTRDATSITDEEFQRIGDEVVTAVQHSRDFTPENIRSITSSIGHSRLGYDPVGAAALRHALTHLDPEAAHYARNLLNRRHPEAFGDKLSQDVPQAPQGHPETFQHPLGSPENPVNATSDAVQSGEVFDTVVSKGRTFHRVRDGVAPMEPQAIRIQADRALDEDDLATIAQMTGYSLRTAGQGEGASDPIRDSPFSFNVHNDTTKGDQYMHLDRFQANLHTFIHQGTPVRKTDRGGPGTKGTRLINGYGRNAPGIEIYYDDASVQHDA